jgi:threonine/homoserine/homoserine lactone efflux protein
MAKRPAGSTRTASPPAPVSPATPVPPALWLAAAAQAIEAAGLFVAGVFAATSTADGRSYQLGSGIALTLIAFCTAVGVAVIAAALARAKPWSRTPVFMTQFFVVIGGVLTLQGNRPEWGVPALALAAVCAACLFTPAALRALNRPNGPNGPPSP